MCSASELEAIDRAAVGVLGFTAADGTPRSCAATPYLINNTPTVTATLALTAKARMLRDRPIGALLAGGVHLAGEANVTLHRGADWFDRNLRQQEPAKYPPARQLLSIPFHRRLLWWYVGRAVITFPGGECSATGDGDRTTITSLVDGKIRITPLPPDIDLDNDLIAVGSSIPDGPACLLAHEETEGMAELLQLTIRGEVRNGILHPNARRGSLEPQEPGALDQIRSLRVLARSAKRNRPGLDALASNNG